jgi:predicted AAA+ superfamily ATPase
MTSYLARAVEPLLLRRIRQFPVVVLAGARQTGKTTLIRRLPENGPRVFRTLDDPTTLETALADPEALLAESARMALDEVQRAPDLMLAVKRAVDRRRTRGRFVLTGSANLLMAARVSESLAGYLHRSPRLRPCLRHPLRA